MHQIFKYTLLSFVCLIYNLKAQEVINDAGLRLGIGIEKKINNNLVCKAKFMTRNVENFSLLNRIYIRGEIDYKIHKNFKIGGKFYYMQKEKAYRDGFTPSYRYAISVTYKTDFTSRFTFSNRLSYQNTINSIIPNENIEDKSTSVLRNRMSLKFKHTRRGSAYLEEEGLFQLTGKDESFYFGRNRIYAGYEYKINQIIGINPYFILERTHNLSSSSPSERTFYYCMELNFSF